MKKHYDIEDDEKWKTPNERKTHRYTNLSHNKKKREKNNFLFIIWRWWRSWMNWNINYYLLKTKQKTTTKTLILLNDRQREKERK